MYVASCSNDLKQYRNKKNRCDSKQSGAGLYMEARTVIYAEYEYEA
jgi:hypothetical protein